MPTLGEWAVTVRNGAIGAGILLALSSWDKLGGVATAAYVDWHGVISHRMCEALVAVASFAAAAFFFSFGEALGARKLTTRLLTDSTRSGVDGSSLLHVRAASGKRDVITFSVSSEAPSDGGKFLPSTPPANFAFWLLLNVGLYLGPIDLSQRFMGDALASLHYADETPPTIWRVLVEVAFSVWAYDFVFWWIHSSWHATFPVTTKNMVGRLIRRWRGWHLQHHDHYATASEPLHPMATFHHHFLDAAAQVGINILVQQVPLSFLFAGPRHKLSKIVHNIVVTYLLVEAHSGLDLPFMSHRLFPAIFGGSVRHQVHHQHGTVYFHQFFRYLDDIAFGAPAHVGRNPGKD